MTGRPAMRYAEKHRKTPDDPYVWRARYKVAEELRPLLPAPYTGRKFLGRSTGIKVVGGDANEAQRLIDKFGDETAWPLINAARTKLHPTHPLHLTWLQDSDQPWEGHFEGVKLSRRAWVRLFAPSSKRSPAPTVTWEPITPERAIAIWTKQANAPEPRAIRHRTNRLRDMLAFVSARRGLRAVLDDLTVITTQEGQAWKESMEAEWPEPSNVPRDRLDAVKGVYTSVAKQGKFLHLDHGNPFARVHLPKKHDPKATRANTTTDDARKILLAARACGDPNLRWLVELETYQGGSHSEIADARLKDIIVKDGILCIHITNKGRRFSREDGSTYKPKLKSKQRPRLMPLHPAVIAGRFLDRVEELRARYGADAALFEEVVPNRRGRRNEVASRMVLGLLVNAGVAAEVDPETGEAKLNDAYSLRHRFVSVLIATKKISNSTGEQRRYLAGHVGRLPGDDKERVGGPHETNYAHHSPADLLPIITAMGDPSIETVLRSGIDCMHSPFDPPECLPNAIP
jgi:integrase